MNCRWTALPKQEKSSHQAVPTLWQLKTNYNPMKKIATAALFIGILALGACASSKPCPAYAKAPVSQEAKS